MSWIAPGWVKCTKGEVSVFLGVCQGFEEFVVLRVCRFLIDVR